MEEEEEQHLESSVNGSEPQKQQPEVVEGGEDQQQLQHRRLQPGAEEKLALQFMDSAHNYLSLFDALSSTLSQGWLELASARHSMGASRINSSVLDLKLHSAATTTKITKYDGTQPCFMLRKWVSSEHENAQLEDKSEQPQDSSSMKSFGLADDEEVQKERSKSLSVFGILISPKLRAAQLSFEKGG
ncbi:putative coiled-coil domain-containing protein [Sesbania bispinosa]|nr:putative coiled-coil domain-containing protein [Sesbania bispinosa]